MRRAYKIFTWMFLFVFIDSLVYNLNKIWHYAMFSEAINQMLFGLSYIVPLNVFGLIMYSQAKFFWEKFICIAFLWFTTTALADELFFDPFKAGFSEHIVGLIMITIIYYYERLKKIRD